MAWGMEPTRNFGQFFLNRDFVGRDEATESRFLDEKSDERGTPARRQFF
ncbi:MAG: hypothetical protein FalmKO_14730 [Falsiruegeria mediterranea]|jgi:hypothetical protein